MVRDLCIIVFPSKHKMKIQSLLFVFILAANLLQAQYTSTKKSAISKYQGGIRAYQMLDFTNAILLLDAAIEKDANFIEPHLVLGDIYTERKEFEKAEIAYNNAIAIDPRFKPHVYMSIAAVEMNLAKYDEARGHLEAYARMEDLPPPLVEKWKRLHTTCVFAAEAIKNPVPFDPKNMGPNINSPFEDYHPSMTVDGKMFVFTGKDMVGKSQNGRPVFKEDLFYAYRGVDDSWGKARNFGPPINTRPYNEGASSISHDGKYLFFTACNREDGLGSCDLYFTWKENGQWVQPRNMGANINTGAWESHPCLSPDGKTLYFASNRSGGKGSSDIWKSVKQADGTWGKPENMPFNTKYSDMTPFIHADGITMYISSEGYPGMGGHDIFIIRKEGNGWGSPVNVGYPINTQLDEHGMIADPNGLHAYYASEREGGMGMLDLYRFDLPQNARPSVVGYLHGTVFDSETKEKLEAEIELIDLENEEVVASTISDNSDGSFLVSLPPGKDYALNVSRKGYLFYSENFSLKKNAGSEPQKLEAPLIPIKAGASMVLKNVFFETGKFELTASSKAELNKLHTFLKTNPTLKVEFDGHTDNQGNEAINKTLSQNRAEAVKKFMTDKGIEATRLTAKGYGSAKPIASNDTDEGRQKNRRTEFRILE